MIDVLLDLPPQKSFNSIGDRALKFAAPKLWNRLSKELRILDTICNFRKKIIYFALLMTLPDFPCFF